LLGTVKVQRKPNNLRIGKTAAAAVAVKKEQRLPCLRTRRPTMQYLKASVNRFSGFHQ